MNYEEGGKKHMTMNELRKEERQPMHLPVRTEAGEGFNEWVIDFSLCGCRIKTPAIFGKNEIITISLFTISRGSVAAKPSYKIGKVMWERIQPNGLGEYGIQFIPQQLMEATEENKTARNLFFSEKANHASNRFQGRRTVLKFVLVAVFVGMALITAFLCISFHMENQKLMKENLLLKKAVSSSAVNRPAERFFMLPLEASIRPMPGLFEPYTAGDGVRRYRSRTSPTQATRRSTSKNMKKSVIKEKWALPVKRILSLSNLQTSYNQHNIKTSIIFLDLLLSNFISWRKDPGLLTGDTLVISKDNVASLFGSLKNKDSENSLDLSSLQQINLFLDKGDYRFEVLLNRTGEQAIPHGFGAKIRYASYVSGRILTGTNEGGPSAALPHITVIIDDPLALLFKTMAFSFLRGVSEMSVVIAEICPVNLGKETNLVGILYGFQGNGDCRAVRSNLEKPALSYVKGTKISSNFLSEKLRNINTFPINLMN
ncbi:MAG: PilZ domain-containing protein [Fibrobacterota bacterium]